MPRTLDIGRTGALVCLRRIPTGGPAGYGRNQVEEGVGNLVAGHIAARSVESVAAREVPVDCDHNRRA